MTDARAFLAIANELADAARKVILSHYRTGVAIDDKSDASPVTLADRGAEEVMRAMINARLPEHGIIGEEFGREREAAEWVWVFDPVDGTKSFVCGRPTFCTLIGLLHFGKPVLGVIDQAVLGERWVGIVGEGTWLNGEPVHVSNEQQLSRARVGSTGPQYLAGDTLERFNRVATKGRFTLWGGDAYLYAQVATGGLEVVVESGLKLHDFAALAPVVIGAGGVMTDWQGHALDKESTGQVVATVHPELHQEVLEVLRY
ncbi:histidinol phosphate phosphatase [Burkholderiaceae bacterium DAT-1]|nr:histidinol phosphate phosphatase [Burkholderiaceae bacterium DAT-1]